MATIGHALVTPEGQDWISYLTKKWDSLDNYVYYRQFSPHPRDRRRIQHKWVSLTAIIH